MGRLPNFDEQFEFSQAKYCQKDGQWARENFYVHTVVCSVLCTALFFSFVLPLSVVVFFFFLFAVASPHTGKHSKTQQQSCFEIFLSSTPVAHLHLVFCDSRFDTFRGEFSGIFLNIRILHVSKYISGQFHVFWSAGHHLLLLSLTRRPGSVVTFVGGGIYSAVSYSRVE